MKLFLFGVLLSAATLTKCCHQKHRRGKRQVAGTDQTPGEMSDFFTACMLRKSKKQFESWRSVVDVSIRDFIWFKAVDEEECKEWQDSVGCWQGRLDALVDQNSVLLGPARECVLEYGTWRASGKPLPQGGYENKKRKKRNSVTSAIPNNSLEGECPGSTSEIYGNCMTEKKSEVTNAGEYFVALHMPSVNKYVLEDVARCRFIPVQEVWSGGRITYKRICKFHRYQDDLDNMVPEPRWQCLAQRYMEILRTDSPLRTPLTECNVKLANETLIHYPRNTWEQGWSGNGQQQWGGHQGGHQGGGGHSSWTGGGQGGSGNALEGLVGYCPSTVQWTSWFNNNFTHAEDGDVETLKELKAKFPDEFSCEKPQGVQIQIANTSAAFHNSGNTLADQSPEKGAKCLNSHQQPGKPCHDFKVRFCCGVEQHNQHSGGGGSSGDPMKRKHGDVVGVCGENDGWTHWVNLDSPASDGSDYETLDAFRNQNREVYGNCQAVAVQAQIARTGQAYDEAHNNLEEVHPSRGLTCRKDMQPIERPCNDFKVRFCCRGMKNKPIVNIVVE